MLIPSVKMHLGAKAFPALLIVPETHNELHSRGACFCAEHLRALLAAAIPNAKPPRIAAVDAVIQQVSAGSNRAFRPAGGWVGSIRPSDERTMEKHC